MLPATARRLGTLPVALGILAALAAGCASSQRYATPSGYQPSAATDSMLVLVEIRERSAIERDIEETAALRSGVESRQERAKTMQARAAALIKIKDAEIKTLAAQADLAKADGNEARGQELKSKKKFAELEKKLLERREDLRQEELDLAKAEADYLKACEERFAQELDLADLRSRRRGYGGGSVTPELLAEFGKLETKVRESEGKALKAGVRSAEKRQKLAAQEVALSKARRKVFEMQIKLLESAGAAD